MSSQSSGAFALVMHADSIEIERSFPLREARKGLPRAIELVVTIAGLLLMAPIIFCSGLAVALSSGRPIFFRQRRVGQHGRTFEMYKLRTMRISAGGPEITSNRDDRITRVGRFLRHLKLDELPTLWNVVRGDMALVGPRPEVPKFVKLDDPRWQKILEVRPGLTDPVTLRLRSEAELLAAVEGDTEDYYIRKLQPSKLQGYIAYLETRNWRRDVLILLRTITAIAVPRNDHRTLPADAREVSSPRESVLNE